MSSWNEKSHFIPTINVNHYVCKCAASVDGGEHHKACPGKPIPLPCPIPRSVTFTVTLGECECAARYNASRPELPLGHLLQCPARPIRVACSIGGKTWEDSHVTDAEAPGIHGRTSELIQRAGERWEIIFKALVLGVRPDYDIGHWTGPMLPLFEQRDAVFAALADMARAETAAMQAQQKVDEAFPYHRFHRVGGGDHRATPPSHARLEAYVEFLIEQVEVLP
jgi:hypothetical protein